MNDPQPDEAARLGRRRREGWLFVAVAFATLVFIVFETQLPPFTSTHSLPANIVFFLLINLNIVLILLVVFLLGRNIVKLVTERRQRVLGSHLRTRLVAGFVAVALVPSLVLFLVALGFTRSSIEDWFSVEVENALEGSLDITDTYYREAVATGLLQAHEVAVRVRDLAARGREGRAPLAALRALTAEKQREYAAAVVTVLGRDGEILASTAADRLADSLRQPPEADLLRDVLDKQEKSRVEVVGNADVVRTAVPVLANNAAVLGAVMIDHVLPKSLGRRRAEIEQSYSQYKQLKLLRRPLLNNYILALVLATLVVIFGGTWIGFAIAKTLTGPIQQLAEGTRAVAEGDLDQRITVSSGSDEIATLVSAFNQMTANLKASHLELAEGRRTVETILANITGGVVSIDPAGNIETVNPAARVILGIGAEAIGRPFRECLASPACAPVRDLLVELEARAREGVWDKLPPQKISLEAQDGGGQVLATGVVLKGENGGSSGALLFLEDVTELLKVQRMEAWREVARRIAHEIKNPLTPIQLSAQRLRKRYARELSGSVLDECTRTIIAEVEVMKNLVGEFSHFARLPAGQHLPSDLNTLAEDALVLFREAHRGVRFVFDRGPDLPLLDLDRDGIRRVLTNLLDNAVAALPQTPAPVEGAGEPGTLVSRAHGYVELVTRFEPAREVVCLEIADDGSGMSPEVKARLFEPYFSTKPQGTGLGLAIASAVLADHQAFIRVRDNQPRGSRFVIEFPVRERRPDASRRAIG
jgi:two-component system nitrogen regulation sensor histidine kinase NtrY